MSAEASNAEEQHEHQPPFMWTSDATGTRVAFSDGWYRFTGAREEPNPSRNEQSERTWSEFVHPDDMDRLRATIYSALETRASYRAHYRLRRQDGDYISAWEVATPYSTPEGSFGGHIGTIEVGENLNEALARLDQEVRQKTRELDETLKELEHFTYSASHDLRAPIRTVAGFANILLEDYGNSLDADGRHLLQRQKAAAMRMEQIISDLLQYSRLGRGELSRTALDLTAMFKEVAADCAADASEKVEFEIQEGMRLHADPALMRVVIENLLANAVKFSLPKGEACVVVGKEDGTVFVKDYGIGFDVEHSAKLFEPFERLHASPEITGTGIGLALVRKVIGRHGGRVWATSVEGEGSIFFFTV